MKKFALIVFLIFGLLISPAGFAYDQAPGDSFFITQFDLNKNIYNLPEFNSLAFILDADQDPGISFRINSEWKKVEFERFAKESVVLGKVYSDLYFEKGSQIELKIENRYFIKNLQIFSQNLQPKGIRAAALSSNIVTGIVPETNFRIIPRSQWLTTSTQEVWEENYYGIDHIIIHHTSAETRDMDGDEDIDAQDYNLMLNSLYNWHANGLAWGDIGYNFVIDPLGNIYEGRKGGDGVIGGHALRSSVCDTQRFGGSGETIGFNHGTVGIAVLGDYQNNENISSSAKASLINLITKLSLEHSLPPNGYNTREGMLLPNVIGHKDIDCTNCPGENVYSQLPVIRTQAQLKYDALKNQRGYKATYIGKSSSNASQVWFEFRNDGNTSWHNYSDVNNDLVYLADSAIKKTLTAAALSEDVSLEDKDATQHSSIQTAYDIANKPNVKPGETGRFYVKSADDEKVWTLALGNMKYFSGTDVSAAGKVSETGYSAELVEKKFAPAFFAGTTPQIVLKYKNTSSKAWHWPEIRLKVTDKANGNDAFYHDGWTNKFGYIAFLNGDWDKNGPGEDNVIEPGEIATWSFDLQTRSPGLYRPMFELVRLTDKVVNEDYDAVAEPVAGSQIDILTRIDADYAAEIVEHTIPPALMTSWRPKVKITFKNIGAKAWDSNLVLRSYRKTANQDWQMNDFHDWSWNSKFAIDKVQGTVEPGQTYTFEFYLDAPDSPGLYTQIYQLEWGSAYEEIMIGAYKQWRIETRVD